MAIHNHSKPYFVYILASGPVGTLYIGVTYDLIRRVDEHRKGIGSEFTKKYKVHALVYYEETTDIEVAIAREKGLKRWNLEWKIELIVGFNPTWKDVYETICQ